MQAILTYTYKLLTTITVSSVQNIKQELKQQLKVRVFLQRKGRNSQNTADSYLRGLTHLQKFLNSNVSPPYLGVKVNELHSLFAVANQNNGNANSVGINVYEFLDAFISYLTTIGLSSNTVSLYVVGVKEYLEHCDIEISPSKFKNKVTMPKNHREDEAAIDDSDIRKILLACHNFRLKVYLLILVSGALRAREALSIRLKDIDFSVTPTKIHIRKEVTKTKVARDIYISEEATTYLKQFIQRKYSDPQTKRIRNDEDLLFRMQHSPTEHRHNQMYIRILKQFQRLLKQIGLEERKEGMQRRKVTFHSFRRFAKTVITNHTSTDFSEWYLGHYKSPYFVQKELDRRLLYATKCMPFLTFTDYSKLEQDATVKQTEVEALMMKDANKDREIELLKQRVQVKDREIELLKQRHSMNTDALVALSERVAKLEKADAFS
jgi:integrase